VKTAVGVHFWTQDSDPAYTVLTLKILVSLGVPDLDELRRQAAAYI